MLLLPAPYIPRVVFSHCF